MPNNIQPQPRDLALLSDLRDLTVLSLDQIRQRHWPDGSRELCRKRLSRLINHGERWLTRVSTPPAMMSAAGLTPGQVYSLSKSGQAWFRAQGLFPGRLARQPQTIHDLLISEWFVRLSTLARARHAALDWRPDWHVRFFLRPDDDQPTLAPDGLAVLSGLTGTLPLAMFLELDFSREAHGRPSSRIARKIHGYDRFLGHWPTHEALADLPYFPAVLFLTHGQLRLQNLANAILHHRRQGVAYALALTDQLWPVADPLTAPLWRLIPADSCSVSSPSPLLSQAWLTSLLRNQRPPAETAPAPAPRPAPTAKKQDPTSPPAESGADPPPAETAPAAAPHPAPTAKKQDRTSPPAESVAKPPPAETTPAPAPRPKPTAKKPAPTSPPAESGADPPPGETAPAAAPRPRPTSPPVESVAKPPPAETAPLTLPGALPPQLPTAPAASPAGMLGKLRRQSRRLKQRFTGWPDTGQPQVDTLLRTTGEAGLEVDWQPLPEPAVTLFTKKVGDPPAGLLLLNGRPCFYDHRLYWTGTLAQRLAVYRELAYLWHEAGLSLSWPERVLFVAVDEEQLLEIGQTLLQQDRRNSFCLTTLPRFKQAAAPVLAPIWLILDYSHRADAPLPDLRPLLRPAQG